MTASVGWMIEAGKRTTLHSPRCDIITIFDNRLFLRWYADGVMRYTSALIANGMLTALTL